jgi:hypothetical protein
VKYNIELTRQNSGRFLNVRCYLKEKR